MAQIQMLVLTQATLAVLAHPIEDSTVSNGTKVSSNEKVGWVSSTDKRSTSGIIWSCLSILLLCSWSCVHLNPPTGRESLGGWHHFRFRSWEVAYWPKRPLRSKWYRRLCWVAGICIAPELGVAVAFKQWQEASIELAWAKRQFPDYQDRLTLTHAFAVEMGAIVVCDVSRVERTPSDATPGAGSPPVSSELVAGERLCESMSWGQGEARLATLDDLCDPTVLPNLRPEDIMDRSKADAFTKTFAIVQSSWLIIQCIVRAAKGLAITELELTTMAFIICALAMYLLWWYKPFGLERRHVLVKSMDSFRDTGRSQAELEYYRVSDLTSEDFNDFLSGGFYDSKVQAPTLGFYLAGTTFSCLHLIAWHFDFPSPTIQHLWRGASLTACACSFYPFFDLSLVALITFFEVEKLQSALVEIFPYRTWGIVFLYAIARLVIWFLTFYCFTSMPASAYESVDWISFIPHFS